DKIMEILKTSPELRIPANKYEFYAQTVVREMVGYGLIDELIQDDQLEEIMIIGPQQPVYVFHRKYEMMFTNIEFYSDKEIEDLINRIARQIGRRVDISSPLLDARLPDGSRVNATILPASVSGASLTIRKFKKDPYSVIDLIATGTLNAQTAAFLWLAVEGMGTKPANILIAGGTGSGKTTTLNVLASFIPDTERIISIEDTAELNLPLQHWIRLEARPPGLEGTGELTLDILTKNTLRMRPDRIIVGEIRHQEAFSLFTAMNTGHEGCLTPETKVALTNGIEDIGTFVERWLSREKTWKEGEWDVCGVENESINSIDGNGKIFRSGIRQARRRFFEGNIYHIRMASGNEIRCTAEHPLYVFDDEIKNTKAEKIREGTWIAAPARLLRDETAQESETEYWSGLLHGDGHILNKTRIRTKNGKEYCCQEGCVSLYTEDSGAAQSFARFISEKFSKEYVHVSAPRPDKNCYVVQAHGVELSEKVITQLDIPAGSRQKVKMSNSHYVNELRSFVAGFFDAEGHVDFTNKAMVFANANEEYISFLQYALLTEGIRSRKYESNQPNSRYWRLYVYGIDQVARFAEIYPIRFPKKIKKMARMLEKPVTANTNVDVIPCNELIRQALQEAKKKGLGQRALSAKAKISQGLISFYVQGKRMPSRQALQGLLHAFQSENVECKTLRQLVEADVFWDKVASVHTYPYEGFVYDLTLNETNESGTLPHNLVANGVLVGNCLGTVHANSAQETLIRVTNPPMNVPDVMLSSLNFVLVQNRLHDKKKGTIRRITEIAEVYGSLEGKTKTQTVFEWNPIKDAIEATGIPVQYTKELQKYAGIGEKQIQEELSARAAFLQKLADQKIHQHAEVSAACARFLYERPVKA
ncbi:MAG: Flp pilus assembly complex ATPase component TadA, partial [Candidatus Diapherotrites archaeon]|nr:Flp pilus assembly complex ATPase component TadA [Candidatus Diapherotrites archaeon]